MYQTYVVLFDKSEMYLRRYTVLYRFYVLKRIKWAIKSCFCYDDFFFFFRREYEIFFFVKVKWGIGEIDDQHRRHLNHSQDICLIFEPCIKRQVIIRPDINVTRMSWSKMYSINPSHFRTAKHHLSGISFYSIYNALVYCIWWCTSITYLRHQDSNFISAFKPYSIYGCVYAILLLF